MSPAEADLRVFAHDALHPHHDRDVRSFAAFPLAFMRSVEVHAYVADFFGGVKELIFQTAEKPKSKA